MLRTSNLTSVVVAAGPLPAFAPIPMHPGLLRPGMKPGMFLHPGMMQPFAYAGRGVPGEKAADLCSAEASDGKVSEKRPGVASAVRPGVPPMSAAALNHFYQHMYASSYMHQPHWRPVAASSVATGSTEEKDGQGDASGRKGDGDASNADEKAPEIRHTPFFLSPGVLPVLPRPGAAAALPYRPFWSHVPRPAPADSDDSAAPRFPPWPPGYVLPLATSALRPPAGAAAAPAPAPATPAPLGRPTSPPKVPQATALGAAQLQPRSSEPPPSAATTGAGPVPPPSGNAARLAASLRSSEEARAQGNEGVRVSIKGTVESRRAAKDDSTPAIAGSVRRSARAAMHAEGQVHGWGGRREEAPARAMAPLSQEDPGDDVDGGCEAEIDEEEDGSVQQMSTTAVAAIAV
jgi:hypothetical protein